MRSRRGKRNDRKGGHAQRADTSEIEGGRQWLRRVRPKYCFQTIHYIRSIRDDLAPTKEDDELEDQEYLSESSEDEHGSVNPGEKRWWGEGTGRIRKRLDPRQPKLEVQEAFLALHDQVNQYAVQEQKETLAHWSKNLGEELHEPYQISPYIKSPAKAFLIPERTIQVLGLTASEHRSASLFPALLARMECLLRAKQVQATMDPMGTLKQLNGVLEALTTEAAGIRNYERLEFLGDGFLKLIATMHVFLSRPKDHEGRIHSARIPLVCNRKLFKLARRLNLGEQIISKPFLPRRWLPPGVTFEGKEEELRVTRVSLKDKQLADVMEAFLGAALRYGPKAGKQSDLDTGIRLAGRLGIRIPQMKAWSEWANQDGIPRRMEGTRLEEVEEVMSLGKQEDEDVSEEEGQIDNLDRVIPRRWYIPSMCYQRLESLGDAILDFLVVEYLIDRFPSLGAGELTVLKGACVSNEILGAICISVGLHQHIQHYSSPLAGDILEYTKRLEVHRRAFEEGADGGFEALGHIEYWREVKPPKVLADVVEAVFGAVFMDDQCRMQGVRGLFSRWILPMIE
ncbi:MAG: ribonuclease III domain-containing protein, partial [Piptocephalis tieghemiana]